MSDLLRDWDPETQDLGLHGVHSPNVQSTEIPLYRILTGSIRVMAAMQWLHMNNMSQTALVLLEGGDKWVINT